METCIKNIGNDNEIDRRLNGDFVSKIRSGFVEVGEEKYCLPVYYKDYQEKIKKFHVRDDDIFITGYPKTGTTWCTEMVWLLVNHLDYHAAKEHTIQKRTGILELAAMFDFEIIKTDDTRGCHPFEYLERLPSPRCIKTHLPWSLLPEQMQNGTKKPKIITTIRNPQDVCISFYHHCKFIEGYRGNFDDFCKLFLAGRAMFGPFWNQVLSYWEERNRSNLLFLRYKDMKKDLPAAIKTVAKFLEASVTDEQVSELAEHLSFESMRNNPAVNFENIACFTDKYDTTTEKNVFIRKGKEGAYKEEMSPELIQRFERWSEGFISNSDLSV